MPPEALLRRSSGRSQKYAGEATESLERKIGPLEREIEAEGHGTFNVAGRTRRADHSWQVNPVPTAAQGLPPPPPALPLVQEG